MSREESSRSEMGRYSITLHFERKRGGAWAPVRCLFKENFLQPAARPKTFADIKFFTRSIPDMLAAAPSPVVCDRGTARLAYT